MLEFIIEDIVIVTFRASRDWAATDREGPSMHDVQLNAVLLCVAWWDE